MSTGFPCPAASDGQAYSAARERGEIRTPLENFRSHVAGGTTDLGEHGQFVFVHDATQTEIGDHDVCILLLGSKQQVLGLQIAVNDTR